MPDSPYIQFMDIPWLVAGPFVVGFALTATSLVLAFLKTRHSLGTRQTKYARHLELGKLMDDELTPMENFPGSPAAWNDHYLSLIHI